MNEPMSLEAVAQAIDDEREASPLRLWDGMRRAAAIVRESSRALPQEGPQQDEAVHDLLTQIIGAAESALDDPDPALDMGEVVNGILSDAQKLDALLIEREQAALSASRPPLLAAPPNTTAAPDLLVALKACIEDCSLSLASDVLALANTAIAEAEQWHHVAAPLLAAPEGTIRELLTAPCIWCKYKGAGYWQPETHDAKCPWRHIGGEFARRDYVRRGDVRLPAAAPLAVQGAEPTAACPHCEDGTSEFETSGPAGTMSQTCRFCNGSGEAALGASRPSDDQEGKP